MRMSENFTFQSLSFSRHSLVIPISLCDFGGNYNIINYKNTYSWRHYSYHYHGFSSHEVPNTSRCKFPIKFSVLHRRRVTGFSGVKRNKNGDKDDGGLAGRRDAGIFIGTAVRFDGTVNRAHLRRSLHSGSFHEFLRYVQHVSSELHPKHRSWLAWWLIGG